MVEFQSVTGKYFFLQQEFSLKDDIEFIDDAEASALYKDGRKNPRAKRTKTVRKDPKNLSDLLDSLF